MKTTTTILSTVIMMTVVISTSAFAAVKTDSKQITKATSATSLKTDMQQLWEAHVTLTRNVILCVVSGQPGIDTVKGQLVANQLQIGNTLKLYYGSEACQKMTKLLYENITLSTDVMIASRNEHSGAYDRADKKWKENTDAIIAFLAQTNPFWNGEAMKTIMLDQLQFTIDEVKAIKDNDNDAATIAYGKAIQTAALMGNEFSEGIAYQFPVKFTEHTLLLGQK